MSPTVLGRQAPPAPQFTEEYADESNLAAILGPSGAFGALALIAVVLRLYVRARMTRSIGADDYVMIAAMIMGIEVFVAFCAQGQHGLGRHTVTISPSDFKPFQQWQYFNSIFIMIGVFLVKISIALFLLRFAVKKSWKRFLWACIVFIVCYCVACAFTLIFNCVPISAVWNFDQRATARCFSDDTFSALGLLNSVINIVTDFIFALLPIPIIVKLQTNLRTKVVLGFILSLGLVACAAAIVKAYKQATFFDHPDPFWGYEFFVWNSLELYLGIIAASLPALKPLFSAVLQSTKTAFSSRGRSNTRSGLQTPSAQNAHNRRTLSAGYRQQYDPRNIHEILGGVEMKDVSHSNSTPSTVVSSNATRTGDKGSVARVKQPYDVRVTSGHVTSFDSSSRGYGCESHGSSGSEERLHDPAPADGILRTMEISRTSEVIR
ncbi:hypothetical protein MBLNU230_g7415t1 [Neophaeotheca triangularis]